MTLQIKRPYYPPAAKVDAANAASREKWLKERVPDTHIRIEFMAWAWEGRLLGEVGDKHVKSIDGGWLNELCQLCLPDGTVIEGSTVDLPNDRICANAAILREERESGVSYVRLHPEDMAEVRAIGKSVALQGEMLDAATESAMDYIVGLSERVKLTEKELAVATALKEHGTLAEAARALEIKHGKGKGFSQPNVVKIANRIKEKIAGATGRNPKSLFTSQEPDRHKRPPEGTNRK